MRIPIWPGVRLSVWEKQNPEAVQIRLARSAPYEPVRRVLSMRGWMLLMVRYDWRDHSLPPAEDPAKSPVVHELTRELHRRTTHLDTVRTGHGVEVSDQWMANVAGEVLGLKGALGIALGGKVASGDADERAQAHYRAWAADHASEWNRCRCEACTAVLKVVGQ